MFVFDRYRPNLDTCVLHNDRPLRLSTDISSQVDCSLNVGSGAYSKVYCLEIRSRESIILESRCMFSLSVYLLDVQGGIPASYVVAILGPLGLATVRFH